MRFWQSSVCSDRLDVKQTNISFAQFNRIGNHFLGCRIEVGWYPALDLWDLIVAVFHGNTKQSIKELGRRVIEQTLSSFNTSHNSKTKAISESDQ